MVQRARSAAAPVSGKRRSSRESTSTRVDRHRALIEVEDADRIQIQAQQVVVRARQDRRHAAEHDEAVARAPSSRISAEFTVISVIGAPHCSCTIRPSR